MAQSCHAMLPLGVIFLATAAFLPALNSALTPERHFSGAISATRRELDWTPVLLSPPTAAPDHYQYHPRGHHDEEEVEEEEYEESYSSEEEHESSEEGNKKRKTKKRKTRKGSGIKLKGLKKLKKYMLPMLIAYKLKFLILIPVLLAGMFLLMGSTAFAGFFFALFATGLGLKKD